MAIDGYIEIALEDIKVFSLKDSSAIFLSNSTKAILIQTEAAFAERFAEISRKTVPWDVNSRPQTYELLANVCRGFEISLNKIRITDLKAGIYFADLVYDMKNELGRKVLEIDSRPSDAILQAIIFNSKVFVSKKVFSEAEDVSELRNKIMARETSKNL